MVFVIFAFLYKTKDLVKLLYLKQSNMKLNNFFLITILFISSCSVVEKTDDDIKTINLKESRDILPISTFIQNIEYLELDISSVNIEIGAIQDLKVLGGDIIIKHSRAGITNFVRFSKNGKFIVDITKNRKGEDLVFKPSDIVEYRNDYAVLGANGIHIISKNGKYKGNLFDKKMPGNNFFVTNNKFYLINSKVSTNFLTEIGNQSYQEELDILNNSNLSRQGYSGISYLGKNKLHLVSFLNDTVFAFSGRRQTPQYYIDAEPNPTFSKVLQNNSDRDQLETLKHIHNTQYVILKNYLENKNFIFMTYWIGSNASNLIINKQNWAVRYFATGVNNIDGGIWNKPGYLSDNNELYIPLSSYEISGHKITDKRHKEFENLQARITASGNPVIMKCILE